MASEGKRFEQNFRKSVPEDIFYYRFRDSAASYYGGNEFLRFSSTNMADALVFNGKKLFICELKAHTGKSIPFSCIKSNQEEMMYNASKYKGVKCYLFVFFYIESRCFALDIKDFCKYKVESGRKSIPISFFEEKGIEIPVKCLKTNHRFLLEDIFS